MAIPEEIVPQEGAGRFTVYASTYARLDSDVREGGGTDDTEVLQAILDKAPEWGGLRLVMDGAALVRGLKVHSNTTIECQTRDCGFFLASGANRSIIQNAHLDFKTIQDRNITLLGGTYNHNCLGQEHHISDPDAPEVFEGTRWVMTMEFYGVEYLTLRDVTIRNQRTFAMLLANWFRVTMEDITIELPENMYAQNQDGIHFWGPGQYLNMRNIMGCSGDDFIALAPDEHDSVSDITDVFIDGVYLNDADQGIRMLSRGTGRLDRVVVRNVTGTFKSFGFFINAWFPGSGGNFGSITLENIDLRQTTHKYDYTEPFLFRLGGKFDTITLRNISHHTPDKPLRLLDLGVPFYTPNDDQVAEASHFGNVILDGWHIYEKEDQTAPIDYIQVFCPVNNLIVRNSQVMRKAVPADQGSLIQTTEQAAIGCLRLSGLTLEGLDKLVDHQAGTIERLYLSDVVSSGSTQPLVAGEAPIGEVQANAVWGAEVR